MYTVCGTANALKKDGDEGGGAMGPIVGGVVGAVVLLGGIALAVVCVCKKKKLPTATVTATTHSVEMKSASDCEDKSIHESGDKI